MLSRAEADKIETAIINLLENMIRTREIRIKQDCQNWVENVNTGEVLTGNVLTITIPVERTIEKL
jgi:hypothetical protein